MRSIVVLVPSLTPAGPVKGAVALANALARSRPVTLFAIKPAAGSAVPVDPAVDVSAAAPGEGIGARRRALRRLLADRGGRRSAAVVSFCLSADLMALTVRGRARIVSSVRGNLPRNYRFDFGRVGPVVAAAHLSALRAADAVVAMSPPMADQVARYLGRRPAVIGNFVDEAPLERFRRPAPAEGTPWRFVFVGSLTPRKQPRLLVDALARLRAAGHDVRADIVGSGPLSRDLADDVRRLGLDGTVVLHGAVAEPFPLIAAADAFVLPSLSEGLSRAALEALQLGVPAVLRDVDGNRSLIDGGRAGILFDDEAALDDAMMRAARLRRARPDSGSLLACAFRQAPCAARYLALAEEEA